MFFVGHVMVDNLLYQRERLATADRSGFESEALKKRLGRYGVVTMHRPSNVDDIETLSGIAAFDIEEVAAWVHPRTRANLE